MSLKRILIENVRSIETLELDFSDQINIIHGGNGAGKTSLLEAIFLLSLGRSFRTRTNSNVIRHGQSKLLVGGTVLGREERLHSLGVLLARDGNIYKLDRKRVQSISSLSSEFPVVCFSPETPSLFLEKSSYRRSFLDWGCFQHSPYFLKNWRSYNRVLKQRNSALRQKLDSSSVRAWDQELIRTALLVNASRNEYLQMCLPEFENIQKLLDLDFELSIKFRSGWGENDLVEALRKSFDSDARRGFTQVGAHRDDFSIRLNSKPLAQVGSRGQIKIAAFALKLLQVKIAQKHKNSQVTFLVDDLTSEFDDKNFTSALDATKSTSCQLFISSVTPFVCDMYDASSVAMFHVKHGNLVPKC